MSDFGSCKFWIKDWLKLWDWHWTKFLDSGGNQASDASISLQKSLYIVSYMLMSSTVFVNYCKNILWMFFLFIRHLLMRLNFFRVYQEIRKVCNKFSGEMTNNSSGGLGGPVGDILIFPEAEAYVSSFSKEPFAIKEIGSPRFVQLSFYFYAFWWQEYIRLEWTCSRLEFFQNPKMFLWTRRIQFWHPCRKFFAQSPKNFRPMCEKKTYFSSKKFPKC